MSDEILPMRRTCGATIDYYQLLETDPNFRDSQMRLEEFTAEMNESGGAMQRRVGGIVKIPVVVHVVHSRDEENISDQQITSQIEVLNNDFRGSNADRSRVPDVWAHLVADAEIEFELAGRDPDGNVTNGITRTRTDRTIFVDLSNDIKFTDRGGIDAWPTDQFLNIWVAPRINDSRGRALLGYAQFPGGRANTDGVVILNTGFGTTGTARAPFNKGRTATHEIGHWLNLQHIWGDTNDCLGTDNVDDTPNALRPNRGDPAFPHITCNNGPDGDMFMNYMDYVNDASMFMFTRGQADRMAAALLVARSSFG